MEQGHHELLRKFTPVSLDEIGRISLRRMETKFMMPVDMLQHFLQAIAGHYSILETAGTRLQAYTTHYFDAPDMRLYLDHHNGYARRIKVRQRKYEQAGDCYFEIKQKRPDNTNDKYRQKIANLSDTLTDAQQAAIKCPHIAGKSLQLKLINTFQRTSLANINTAERITIDTNIKVNNTVKELSLAGTAIIEVKLAKYNRNSAAMQYAQTHRLQEQSFSKYAVGAALLYPSLKTNNFKYLIQKHIHGT